MTTTLDASRQACEVPHADADVRWFSLDAQYRRCGVYLVVGVVLVNALAELLTIWGLAPKPHGPETFFVEALLLFAAVAFCIFLFRWRLRVDFRGVARRRLWHWDVWPWEAFEDGRIRRANGRYRFVCPTKPIWNRMLVFEFLSEANREFVYEVCRRICGPEELIPARALPDELAIRYSPWNTMRLTPDGITLGSGRGKRCFAWQDVSELRFIRLEHDRALFGHVEIELDGLAIELRQHEGRPTWRGADRGTLQQFLLRYVPADRTRTYAIHDEPRSIPEIDYRMQTEEKRTCQLKFAQRMLAATFAIGIGFCVLRVVNIWPQVQQQNRQEAALTIAVASVLLLSVVMMLMPTFLMLREQRTKTQQRLTKLADCRARLSASRE
jgi:hypothetical protein